VVDAVAVVAVALASAVSPAGKAGAQPRRLQIELRPHESSERGTLWP
jgi:hypothetical protein